MRNCQRWFDGSSVYAKCSAGVCCCQILGNGGNYGTLLRSNERQHPAASAAPGRTAHHGQYLAAALQHGGRLYPRSLCGRFGVRRCRRCGLGDEPFPLYDHRRVHGHFRHLRPALRCGRARALPPRALALALVWAAGDARMQRPRLFAALAAAAAHPDAKRAQDLCLGVSNDHFGEPARGVSLQPLRRAAACHRAGERGADGARRGGDGQCRARLLLCCALSVGHRGRGVGDGGVAGHFGGAVHPLPAAQGTGAHFCPRGLPYGWRAIEADGAFQLRHGAAPVEPVHRKAPGAGRGQHWWHGYDLGLHGDDAHRGLCQLVWRQRQRCDLRARGTESGSRERRAREGIVSQQPFSDACDGACDVAHHVR